MPDLVPPVDAPLPRRKLLKAAAGLGAAAIGGSASAQSFDFKPNQRYYMASCHSLYALYVEAQGAV